MTTVVPEIVADSSEITIEDMIVEEDMMVMITHGRLCQT